VAAPSISRCHSPKTGPGVVPMTGSPPGSIPRRRRIARGMVSPRARSLRACSGSRPRSRLFAEVNSELGWQRHAVRDAIISEPSGHTSARPVGKGPR
jgi:hypothetical protein